jgi:hypothetical protein
VAANFTLPPTDHIPTAGNAVKESAVKPRGAVKEGGDKVGNGGKGDLSKGEKEPKKKKNKEGSAQVNAKDHSNKPQEAVRKKNWLDLFRRNAVTAQ